MTATVSMIIFQQRIGLKTWSTRMSAALKFIRLRLNAWCRRAQCNAQKLLLVRRRRSPAPTVHNAPGRVVQQHWIKWPAANQHKVWCQFDEDAARIITATAKGDADKQLQTVTNIIVSFATERFGVEECKTSRPNHKLKSRQNPPAVTRASSFGKTVQGSN